MSSEDVDRPTPTKAKGAAELPWYMPAEGETFHAPHRQVWTLAASYDLKGFFNSKTVSGVGSQVAGHLGNEVFGFSLGVYAPGPWWVIGADVGRYSGLLVYGEEKPTQVRVLYPFAELAIVAGNGIIPRIGTSITGLRVTQCGPIPLRLDFRVPTFDVWFPVVVNNDSGNMLALPLYSAGFSLDVGGLL
jgi:hypothetical protein